MSSSSKMTKKKGMKLKRPDKSRFVQQSLPAWQFIFTPWSVLPLLFVLGVIFAPLGGAMYVASQRVKEVRLDYTHCLDTDNTFTDMPATNIVYQMSQNNNVSAKWRSENDHCYLRFQIPEKLGAPLFSFYRLTNFYQNHRRYTASVDVFQLRGEPRSPEEIKVGECSPLDVNEHNKPYYPCGLIANSLFNDTFSSLVRYDSWDSTESLDEYQMTSNGTAWPEDKERYIKTSYNASDVVPPPNWSKMYPNGYTDDNLPDISNWDELQVWMRIAALPTFSKLAKKNATAELNPGIYEVDIAYNFPVIEYNGTKTFMLSTTTAIGGKNYFLGIMYMVIGGINIASGIILSVACMIKRRRVGDPRYLSWNKEKTI
ncbi:CDC50 domain-containing protein [Schizosaccharomyces cryophilus OY26]|uniref:CDC50 domain-containing protein n=1 Tax=Schizosaccharomyces cryophilus (strain OY26 / ATCC MYA-4695 / CBS 11777 / NBRC 106824 / NRRL Y48691) TaxID=653667 RepID=S9WWU4_SCHCR|nr:CDC50 domain-containing protein [Schizosaccharomyces cryophilus OY26]EPY49212.1 CDC50 domain-containing protein [Schizosaccharomyces cryophilus OY26]